MKATAPALTVLFHWHAPVAACDKTFLSGRIDGFGTLMFKPLEKFSAFETPGVRIDFGQRRNSKRSFTAFRRFQCSPHSLL